MSAGRLRLAAGPPAPDGLVSALVDRSAADAARLGVALAPGAGGDLQGAGLAALAGGLAARGYLALRFNLPYREAGRATPPAAERSVDGYRAAIEDARRQVLAGPWVVGGKSYGGRVASLAVAGGLEAAGLVFYGYPLHAPGREESVRVAHWPSIRVPCLFLEGTADPFCNLELLRRHLPALGAPATLHVVEGGDHSLGVSAARSPDGKAAAAPEVMAGLAAVVVEWLATLRT
ncbi:MAG TPA: alpha/beta family hydrolase [Actinomycetota bacterium]|nr:alpha/beta family hydrolase [Actinomycetota bacterium]